MSKSLRTIVGALAFGFALRATMPHRLPPALALLGCLAVQDPAAREFRTAREGVLGTSCEMVVSAATEAAAAEVETAVLQEIERLQGVLSQWQPDSELRKALAAHGPVVVSTDLQAVLRACDAWRERTHGAFQPGVAALEALWRADAEHPPEPATLEHAVHDLDRAPWTLRDGAVEFHGPVTLEGLAKGYVLDRAFAAGNAALPNAHLALLVIGGDLRVDDVQPRAIAVRDPRRPADNDAPLYQLHLRSGAVASSGGYRRGFAVHGVAHSHVFDPHTGSPADAVLGATVVAADAVTADALATALCVLGPRDGLATASAAGAEAVVVTADGTVTATAGLLAEPTSAASAAGWPAGYQLDIAFTLRAPSNDGGGRRRGGWRRPYVAAWIEDPSGHPVRTLCLWVESLRYLPELHRWYRLHRGRDDMVDAVSMATRKAGSYSLVWDGTDDGQRALAAGDYVFCLEASREHGTYQLIKKPFTAGAATFAFDLDGNEEIEKASLQFRARGVLR